MKYMMKNKPFLLLIYIIFLSLSVASAETIQFGNLAADETAARYRTGAIDPAILRIPPAFQANILKEPEKYLPQLVSFLRYNAENDYQVVKRIHDWITDTIAYEFTSRTDVYGVLQTGRTNCTGYSALFKEMTSFAGIKSEVVFGFSKTYLFGNGEQGNHAWNIVFIAGKQYLLDTTHDARSRAQNGIPGEKRPYTDDELFLNPAHKILFNFPYESRYQLLEKPVSYEEYMSQLRLRLAFFKYGLEITDPVFKAGHISVRSSIPHLSIVILMDGIETRGQARALALKVPEKVEVRLMVGDDLSQREMYVTREKQGSIVLLHFFAPGKGTYRASIEARYSGTQTWENVYTFMIIENEVSVPVLKS
jgi:hypothetical protein